MGDIKIGLMKSAIGVCMSDSCGSGYGSMAGLREHGNEPPDSIKGVEFID
jgi:hypothetical protein